MHIFDGRTTAMRLETALQKRVEKLRSENKKIKVAAVLFHEDVGSRFYSEYKRLAAERVGIAYELHAFSIATPIAVVMATIENLNQDQTVTGIIIQKPTGRIWRQHNPQPQYSYGEWWERLYQAVDFNKDVDGLHPTTMAAIENGTWQEEGRVLPATVRAVQKVMQSPEFQAITNENSQYLIIGKSDLLGKPLYHLLKHQGRAVEMIGKKGFAARMKSGQKLTDADVIITATGREYLVTGEMIKKGAALIDVGEPRPDLDQKSLAEKAAFITPVPGGVGPLTVVSLLENAVALYQLCYNTPLNTKYCG